MLLLFNIAIDTVWCFFDFILQTLFLLRWTSKLKYLLSQNKHGTLTFRLSTFISELELIVMFRFCLYFFHILFFDKVFILKIGWEYLSWNKKSINFIKKHSVWNISVLVSCVSIGYTLNVALNKNWIIEKIGFKIKVYNIWSKKAFKCY